MSQAAKMKSLLFVCFIFSLLCGETPYRASKPSLYNFSHQVHCCVCTKWCAVGNCGVAAALYCALYCMCWSDWALYAEKGIPAWKVAAKSWALRVWQGFPSLTKTGTATRLGEGRWVTSIPFSARALFILYRWFWNQIFTWVGVRRIKLARCSLSGADRYLCCLKRRSSS